MQKEVRICEVCGTINKVNSSECISCNDDLAYTSITIITEEESRDNEEVKVNLSAKKEVNSENTSSSTNVKKTMVLSTNKLINRNDGKEIEIPFTGCLIGREGNTEVKYFEGFPYISNRHAILEYNFDEIFIMDLGSTNGTKVNGNRLNNEEKIKLKNGDIIQFANIEFIIS